MGIVFLDKEFLKEEEAKLPITDRGLLYGDGLYTTILVEEGVACFLDDHLRRLKDQCALINLTAPDIKEETIFELIRQNRADHASWRLKIFITGGHSKEHHLRKRRGSHLFMTIHRFIPPPYRPLNFLIFPAPVMAPHATFKSLSSLHRFYLADYAEVKGGDDAISLTESNIILEASFGNLFWIHEKTFYTPDPLLPLYFGVTIEKMVSIAHQLGFQVEFVKKRLSELPDQAFLFRANTLRGIRPIGTIGKRCFSRSLELEEELLRAYKEIKKRQGKQSFRFLVNSCC